jgi:hypothetical protein
LTAANSAERQAAAFDSAMDLHGVHRVLGAGGREPAAKPERPEYRGENRGDGDAINAPEENQRVLGGIHGSG